MKVELIEYTQDGINLIARLARATRKNELEDPIMWNHIYGDNSKYIETADKNKKFVKALLNVQHLGILEHITFTFHVSEISRVLTHQLVRHRMTSYLQQSDRHVKPIDGNYIIPDTIEDKHEYMCYLKNSYDYYDKLIAMGVPIEDARYVLPPAFFTQITMTCNARSLLHFLELRMDMSAQAEIRELACRIYDIVYPIYPVIFESLKELRDKNVF